MTEIPDYIIVRDESTKKNIDLDYDTNMIPESVRPQIVVFADMPKLEIDPFDEGVRMMVEVEDLWELSKELLMNAANHHWSKQVEPMTLREKGRFLDKKIKAMKGRCWSLIHKKGQVIDMNHPKGDA